MSDKASSKEFAERVLNSEEVEGMAREEFLTYMEEEFGFTMKPADAPRYTKGKRVIIEADAHKDEETRDIYEQYDGEVGEVILTHREDPSLDTGDYPGVVVRLDSGEEVHFPQAQKSRCVGIKSEPVTPSGPLFEAVYIKGTDEVTQEQKEAASRYLERGEDLGEERDLRYYSGVPCYLKETGSGNAQFGFLCQQRRDDLTGELKFRSFSVPKGTLLYIGKLGHRAEDLEALQDDE